MGVCKVFDPGPVRASKEAGRPRGDLFRGVRPDVPRLVRMTDSDDNGQSGGGGVLGWILAAALLLGGVALIVVPRLGDEQSSQPQPAPGPLVETVQPETVGQGAKVRQTAFLRAADAMQVVSEVPGRVMRVADTFQRGARVGQGELLFALDDRTYRTDVDRAQARVKQAQARRDQAENTLRRQQELEDNDFASEAALEEARTAQAQAEGDLALARAELRSAEIALADTEVRAPYDALVTGTDISQGQFLQPGVPAGRIARLDHAELRVGLSERQFTLLGGETALMGAEIWFEPQRIGPLPADMALWPARIIAVSPVIDEGARVIEVTARVAAPFVAEKGRTPLQINQLVTAIFDIPADDATLYAAPLAVVQTGNRIWQVADGRLRLVAAQITRQTDTQVFFTADAYDGGALLATPVDTPVDGLRVRVAGEAEDATTSNGDGS